MKSLADMATHTYALAVEAGEKIMLYYSKSAVLSTQYKTDHSPLTIADTTAHDYLYQVLSNFAVDEHGPVPILSEEGEIPSFAIRQYWQRYWCVDPLDGTKNFLEHNDEFTVNIALICAHEPVLGIIYAPALKQGYMAWRGGGAYRCDSQGNKERIRTQSPHLKPIRLLLSRHHGETTLPLWLADLDPLKIIRQGSALKFGTLAQGQADLFLRSSASCEWDNAAGQCLVQEAGGALWNLDFKPMQYNFKESLLQEGFLAVGDKYFKWLK